MNRLVFLSKIVLRKFVVKIRMWICRFCVRSFFNCLISYIYVYIYIYKSFNFTQAHTHANIHIYIWILKSYWFRVIFVCRFCVILLGASLSKKWVLLIIQVSMKILGLCTKNKRHTWIHAYWQQTYTHTHTHKHTHTHTHTYIYLYIHTYTHTHTHTYMYIYIYIYIYAASVMQSSS